MSAGGPTARLELRTAAFCDLESGLWGVTVAGGPYGEHGTVRLGSSLHGAARKLEPAALEGSRLEADWSLRSDGIELSLSPAASAGPLELIEHRIDALCQPCRVRGYVSDGRDQRRLDCPGQRGSLSLPAQPARYESLRELTAWFESGDGVTLLAARPPRARGHDDDAISAVMFEAGDPVAVGEPRLSSTYSALGLPARASLELWLEAPLDTDRDDHDDSVPATQTPRHFPRRVGGEATGAFAELSLRDLAVRAELFRWHMSDMDGAGLYVLARAT